MIEILLNDQPAHIDSNTALNNALQTWGYDVNNAAFAVAVNMTFVPNSDYADTLLQSGDKVEIVTPSQGG